MFTPNAFIDTVQTAKKQVVETFVTDKDLKKSIIEVIDAQTTFVKTATQNTIDISKMIVDNYTKVDYTKFFTPAK